MKLGSNDLAKGMNPEIVASKLFDVCEQLHNLNGSAIGFMSVLPRTQNICMSPEKYFNKLMISNSSITYPRDSIYICKGQEFKLYL